MPDKPGQGWYVYGVVESTVEVVPGRVGLAGAEVDLVHDKRIAALVSNIDLDRPIGTPEDLRAHKELLDATAADAPVLPFRFGAVLESRQGVLDELLEPHDDEFADALRDLDGKAQYVVRARYIEQAVLREILAENPKAAKMREKIGPEPDASTRNLQIQLGEMINTAVEAKRDRDTSVMVETLEPVTVTLNIRPPTHELDAAHIAFLERIDQHSDVEDALTDLAESWSERAQTRLLGPMAAYDFVVTTQ